MCQMEIALLMTVQSLCSCPSVSGALLFGRRVQCAANPLRQGQRTQRANALPAKEMSIKTASPPKKGVSTLR